MQISLFAFFLILPSIMNAASLFEGAAAEEAEVRKHRANDPKCSELGWVCIPLAVETYGNWGREAQSTFSRLASHLAIITSSHKSKALYSRLNFTLVRAVARALVAAVRPSCPFCVELGIEGRRVQFDIDTGSAVTLVSERTWKKLNLDVKLRNSRVLLRTYTGDPISVVGEAKVAVSYNQQLSTLVLYVVKGTGPSLLGRDWLRHIKLDWKTVGQVASVNRATMLDSLLKRYHEVFQGGLGTLKGVHARLQVKPNAVPKFFKARTVPFAELNSKTISTSSVTEEVKQVSSSTSTSNQHGHATKQSEKRNGTLNAKGIKQSQKRNGPLNAKAIKQSQKRNALLKGNCIGRVPSRCNGFAVVVGPFYIGTYFEPIWTLLAEDVAVLNPTGYRTLKRRYPACAPLRSCAFAIFAAITEAELAHNNASVR
eukprot:Em0005g406a